MSFLASMLAAFGLGYLTSRQRERVARARLRARVAFLERVLRRHSAYIVDVACGRVPRTGV